MTSSQPIIDLKELVSSVPGEGLEALVRHLGRKMGLTPSWSGRGADRGRDLCFTEILSGVLGNEKITWLVSCKDKAKSGQSVTPTDLPQPGIRDVLEQHRANGFLLVTTTTVSTNAKELLDRLDKAHGGAIHTRVWDATELTAFLLNPENHHLLQEFLPESYRRVAGLTSLEGALLAFRDRLPEAVLDDVMRMVRPYSSHSLKGSSIWPTDSQTASHIDAIIRRLLLDQDVSAAVAATRSIGREPLMALSIQLHNAYPTECLRYLSELIERHDDEDQKYDTFSLLIDAYPLTHAEIVRLAPYVDDAESLVYCPGLEDEIRDRLLRREGDYELYSDLDDEFGQWEVTGVSLSAAHYEIEEKGKISFWGEVSFEMDVRLVADPRRAPIGIGEFSGYFDAAGVFVERVSLDLVSFS